MLKKALHIVFVTGMYLLLLFGTTAKEFIHLFSGHEDTVHMQHEDGVLSFENEHHHCDFLSYSLPAFDNDVSFPVLFFRDQVSETEYILTDCRFVQRELIRASQRGPPTLTA